MLVTLSGMVMLVEAGASREGLLPDAGDAITNRDARQAGAFAEGVIPNTSSLSVLARSAVKKIRVRILDPAFWW